MTAPVDLRYSDPLTGSGSIDGSNVGVTDAVWADVVGTGTRGGSALAFSGAVSGTAFAVADFGMADFDVQVKTHSSLGGDALYVRMSDANNWIRGRQRQQVVSSGYWGPWYGTGWVFDHTAGPYPPGAQPGSGYFGYQNGIPTTWAQQWTSGGSIYITYYTQSVTRDWYSSSSTYRYIVIEKCVAGVVSTMASWQVSDFGVLRISGYGDDLLWYKPDGISVQGGVTDSFNNSATKHGIGIGGSDSTSYGSNLRGFVLQLPGSLVPPSIVSPADGADVELGAALPVTVASNYGPDNALTRVDGRWRVQGAGSWTDAPNVLATPGTWNIDTSGLTAPVQVEVQVRGTDSFGNLSGWSSSSFVWLRTAPTPPVFIAPSVDATVVAANIATVDFSDATVMQARRMADNSGLPSIEVLEDGLTLTAVGSYFRLSGDGAIHPQGTEHIQVRRQTSAGGSLWSTWESLRVEMQLAHPSAPDVSFTTEPDSASIVFSIGIGEGSLDYPDAVRMDILRDGVMVVSRAVSAPSVETWADRWAGPTGDYEIRLLSDNGGVVTVK